MQKHNGRPLGPGRILSQVARHWVQRAARSGAEGTGYVVNINHIREVVPWFKSSYQLHRNDKHGTEIPVSRAPTKRLRELFNL